MQSTETSNGPSYTRSGVSGTFLVGRGSGLSPFAPSSINFSRWKKTDADVSAADLRDGGDFYVMWGYYSRNSAMTDGIYSPLNSDHTVEQLDKFFRFRVE